MDKQQEIIDFYDNIYKSTSKSKSSMQPYTAYLNFLEHLEIKISYVLWRLIKSISWEITKIIIILHKHYCH